MLTVLFATKNRARILSDVLESFCHLVSPDGGWKLVVVDNGSTDDTLSVLSSFSNRLPLMFVTEPSPGKNAALNTGLAMAEGDLTVFTDDDVFPHTDWLVQLRTTANAHPDYAIFGGAVVPRWEVPPQGWVGWVEWGPVYALTPKGVKEGELTPEHITLVYGPNMMIRTAALQSSSRFDTSIGPKGSSYPMGSETELVQRLSRQGHRAWHVSSAIVEHLVRKEQMEQSWVLQRGIRCGRGRHRLSPPVRSWRGIPLHLIRDVPKEAISVALAWALLRHEALFRARWRLNILLGKYVEARNITREMHAYINSNAEGQQRSW
jgi:GT2 family glycosyltransferase